MSEIIHSVKRPTSPHLQVYRLPLTALLSVAHRASGAGLSMGMILIAAFLIAAAGGEQSYDFVMSLATSLFGMIIMFLWSVGLYFHTFNGIRHMVWDMGYCLDKDKSMRSNYAVIAATTIATIGTWAFACPVFSSLLGGG